MNGFEIVGQIVVPSAVAFSTAFGFFFAKGRNAGALEERVKGLEAHAKDGDQHCAPEHHARLARIEERVDGIKDSLDVLASRRQRRRSPAKRR